VQCREVDALHVDRIDPVEFGFGHFEVGLVAVRPAGVVDHAIQATKLRRRRPDELRPVACLGDIGLHELAADLLGDARAAFRVDVVDDELRAFLREAPGDAGAEARSRAGDEGDLVFQSHDSSCGFMAAALPRMLL
jgi:hypothetical protein